MDGVVPQPVTHLSRIEVAASAGRQRMEHLGVDELAGRVVTSVAPTGLVDDATALLASESQSLQPVADHEIGTKASAAVADRSTEDPRHAQVALDPSRDAAVVALEPLLGNEVREDGELDSGLAERRQHLFDVAEEQAGSVRPPTRPGPRAGTRWV